MKKGIVLSLCDYNGAMVKPWADAGYECLCVGKLNEDYTEDNITFLNADITRWLPPKENYAFVFAFPPHNGFDMGSDTEFFGMAFNHWLKVLEVAVVCMNICKWSKAPWMLENPSQGLHKYIGEPNYHLNPADYGDFEAFQDSSLWTSSGFVMPSPSLKERKTHTPFPFEYERRRLEGFSSGGFAQAIFEANCMPNLGRQIHPQTSGNKTQGTNSSYSDQLFL